MTSIMNVTDHRARGSHLTMVPHHPDSTVRLELLGEDLRAHREAAGFSLADVAGKIGISTSKLSRMENGRKPQKAEDVAALLAIYGVKGTRREDLLALARSAGDPAGGPGIAPASRLATLRILEAKATMLVDYQSSLVPALLQTVPYAQAALREVGMVDEDSVEEQWTTRIHRQAVLRRVQPPQFFAIIAEPALRVPVGGREVLRGQLRYLLEAGQKKSIAIRVVPDRGHGHPGLGGPFERLQFDQRGAVVVLENRTSTLFVEDLAEIKLYDRVFVELLSVSLGKKDSLAMIADLADAL
ncbi:helix-turn-helix domain-containing protein [Actinokineospora sp.]|uniref:helix-turn-helix domain-containing protein n=1 Tax=Actinokineospora sp. TaxID=1872133 RepID=UPI004037F3E6